MYDYEFKKSMFIKNGKQIELKFHMYTSRIVKHPQLQVIMYYPVDQFTRDYFDEFESRLKNKPTLRPAIASTHS